MSETARVDEAMDGNVLVLTINYPQRKNAIAPAVRAALEDAIERETDRLLNPQGHCG